MTNTEIEEFVEQLGVIGVSHYRIDALEAFELKKYIQDLQQQIKGSPDSNVENNRKMLLQRSIVGLAKYGVTTDNNPLSLREWLQHALEEALDMANYLQAAISKLDQEGAKHDNAN